MNTQEQIIFNTANRLLAGTKTAAICIDLSDGKSAYLGDDAGVMRMLQNKDQSGAAVRGEAVAREYFYKVDACKADDGKSPECICWHKEGTGPLANCAHEVKHWRPAAPVSPRAADAPSEPSDKFGLLRIADNGKSVTVVADERFWSGDCSIPDGMYRIVSDVGADALDSQPAESAELNGWQPIETAPTVKGDYFFCSIAWGPEGEQLTGDGMRWNGRWFVAPVFHALGKERKCEHREIEVQPTHWRPSCPAPASSQPTDADGCAECRHTYCMSGEVCKVCGDVATQGWKGGRQPTDGGVRK